MPKELERYNHLRYENSPSDGKDFVDFLYENTELTAPDVDVDNAWEALQCKLESKKTNSNSWLRIAASITILIGISFFIWTLSTAPDQMNISSLDEKIEVTFPDGSKGVLNENSTFSFLDKFGDERLVAFEGEAYFDVKKSDKPFIIEMGDVQVRVLGTAFNLETSTDEVELVVERGLVAFEKDGIQTKVAAGLKAIYSISEKTVSISENKTSNVATWIDGRLEFNDVSMENVLQDLSDHFDVNFNLMNEDINACNVTATFERNTLPEIIETLESMLGVSVSETEEGIMVISGEGC